MTRARHHGPGGAVSCVTVGQENTDAIRIYYEDHGRGAPVVLVHGYLLDGHSWEKQEAALLAAGYRVITYGRRGFGASSRPSVGYDYDTLDADLAVLLDQLDLRQVVLAGFCAGTGEVTRYLGTYGHRRVRAAALLAPLPPCLPRGKDNPDGVDRSVLDEFISQISADRLAATKTFLDQSYNIDLLGGVQVSDQAWQNSFHVAIGHPRRPCQAAPPRGWKTSALTWPGSPSRCWSSRAPRTGPRRPRSPGTGCPHCSATPGT